MLTKAVINSIKEKKIVVKNMASYGGMPSSHTAFVMSFVFGIALDKNYGFSHPILAFAIIVSSVIMMDAVRLRGTIDKLNDIIKDLTAGVRGEKAEIVLPKKIAHTTKEVISGIVFAFVYTFIFYLFFYSLFGK
jgi:acid phosphatase family membrane protein YuiD